MIPRSLERHSRWVEDGTAQFLRLAQAVNSSEFALPVGLPGWTRAHVVAHVGYNARALTRLVEWARTGIVTPMYASADTRNEEIALGSTLGVPALRNLLLHSSVHLESAWDSLPEAKWTYPVFTAQGREVPVSETLWLRIREVWIHGVDLGCGLSFDDFPADLVDDLLADVTGLWERKGQGPSLALCPIDRKNVYRVMIGGSRPTEVLGPASDLLRWVLGRGVSPGIRPGPGNDQLPELGRWL